MPIAALPDAYQLDGGILRRHREQVLKVRREEIAVRLGCSVSRVAHVENNRRALTVGKAATFAAAYGLRLDDCIVPADEREVAH
jgi:transcriptional regulator with XRE-family HTH domain